MNTFTLTITMGNDAMSEPDDVRRALDAVSESIAYGATSGRIFDDNGNTVGEWGFNA